MILNFTGELIGDCGLVRQTVDGTDEIEIGYHVRRDQWGHGYASEAARACRDYGFANLKVDKLISLIRPENIASPRRKEWHDDMERSHQSESATLRLRNQA